MSEYPSARRVQRRIFGALLMLAIVAVVCVTRYSPIGKRTLPSERAPLPEDARQQALLVSETVSKSSVLSDDRIAAAEPIEQGFAEDRSFSPANDGWESESFIESAKQQLLSLVKSCRHRPVTSQGLSGLVTADVSCQPLRPRRLRDVFADDRVVIRRRAETSQHSLTHRGPDGLAEELQDLVSPFTNPSDIEFHLKFHGVSILSDSIVTTVDFEAHGQANGGMVQQNATWTCTWTKTRTEPPRLMSIVSKDFEEVVAQPETDAWFADCTEAVLKNNPSFNKQLAFGLNHWMRRIGRSHGMQIYTRTGLAVGDVNGDGLDDVYVCQPGGLPNRLFVQNEDGTASDRSHASGVDWLDESHGVLLVDLDNDGDQDIVLACTAGVILMSNDSKGRFKTRRHLKLGRSVQSLSAVDYDNDGDLDLYVCAYRANSTNRDDDESTPEFIYHDANNGGANRMFRNDLSDRQWKFSDVTRECGLDESNRRWSMAASWEDFDNDGDQDLYVANDYGQNCLYRNDEGRFTDIAKSAGVVDYGSGMSVSWSDYDRDGWMDLYVGNMFSSAGNRIATQQRFMASADDPTRTLYRRFAKGNSLFRNVGGKGFRDVGFESAVEMARWAWSSLFVDINNDGWQDLIVANGFITAADDRDL